MGQLYATRARDPTDLPSAEGLARVERLESGHGYLTARFRHNMKIPASDSPPSLPFEGKAKPRARTRGKKLFNTNHVVFVPRGSLPYSYPLSFGVGPHSPLRTHGTQILRFGRCHRRVAPSPCQPGVRGRTRVSRTEVLAKRMCWHLCSSVNREAVSRWHCKAAHVDFLDSACLPEARQPQLVQSLP